MRPDLGPHHVGEIVPFSDATCDHLVKQGSKPVSDTYGAIFKDGQLAWLLNGTSLEVVSTRTGECHASCRFSPNQRVTSATCADSFQQDNSWKLVVGTDNGSDGGSVCLIDIKSSRLVKCISIPERVTCVSMVSTAGGINPLNRFLGDKLRYFYGIVAVGTSEGCVYLLDLQLEQETRWTDESTPADMEVVNRDATDIPARREEQMGSDEHLAILLNESSFTQNHFQYKSPDNSVYNTLTPDDICVTAISYVHQTTSLLVGFNFGGFQIWSLDKLQLVHTSPWSETEQLPVVRFAFQEPENDPRNFCYVWVVNGSSPVDPSSRLGTSFASLYAVTFANKSHVKSMGHCYRDMQSCVLRFDFDLCHEMGKAVDTNTMTSRLVTCSVVRDDVDTHSKAGYSDDTNSGHDDVSRDLCVFVWETTLSDHDVRPQAMLAVFDLNQWYLAQMPSQLSQHVRMERCPYLGFFSMAKISEEALPDFILDVHVPPRSICRVQSPSTEEPLFYPSSLALDTCCLIETGIIHASFLGLQGQIIYDLKRVGPEVLINPKEVFNMCAYASLLGGPHSEHHDTTTTTNLSAASQREAILSLALEHNLVDFLVLCINEWSQGHHVQEGCTLRFLQEWAWRRATAIKSSLDRQCSCLYDCSGLRLSGSAVHSLHSQATQLKHLEFVFRALLQQIVPTTELGLRELESKVHVISMLALHLEVVLYFINAELLPENAEGEPCAPGTAYPYSTLHRIYAGRRQGLRRLNGALAQSELLMIDGLVSHAGDSLLSLWSKEGGDGLYPPPSLHALLNIYLLDEVDTATKHRIVQYLFLDVAELIGDDNYSLSEQLVRFPSAFSLSPSLIKVTQGFWMLDRKDFEDAVSALLHPMIGHADILPWQHLRVMKACLYQGQAQLALRYARVRKPALHAPDEVRFHLTLLLANGLVPEAFQYQRENRDNDNAEDLLRHLFLGAEQTKQVSQLLKLSLCPFEESQLIHFLRTSTDAHARELLVVYFLQRSRYVDAMQVNEHLLPRVMADPAAKERADTRAVIVDGFVRTLPRVQTQLTKNARDVIGVGGRREWQQLPRPRPLSTCVRTNQVQPMSKSALIANVMEKIAQMWNQPPPDHHHRPQLRADPRLTPAGSKRKFDDVYDTIPLVSTPTVGRRLSRSTVVVFPTLVGQDGDMNDSLYQASPAKKTRYLESSPLRLGEGPNNRRRSSVGKFLSADALSLLQTPPVKRRTPVGKSVSATPGPGVTPHSILKVRPVAASPVLVPVDRESDDSSLPSTPGLAELSAQSSVSSFDDDFVVAGRSGLRQLRFGVSVAADESSKEEEEEEQVVPTMSTASTGSPSPGGHVVGVSDRELQPSPRPPLHPEGVPSMVPVEADGSSYFDMEVSDDEEKVVDTPLSSQLQQIDSSVVVKARLDNLLNEIISQPSASTSSLATPPTDDVVQLDDSDPELEVEQPPPAPVDRRSATPNPPPIHPPTVPSRTPDRTAPCMPPAGLDLGEMEYGDPHAEQEEEEGVQVRVRPRNTGPFPASFSSLLDRTIPSFLEGVPCAVDKAVALSSLSREPVPTERRFLKQHHVPDPARRGQPVSPSKVDPVVSSSSSEDEEEDVEDSDNSEMDEGEQEEERERSTAQVSRRSGSGGRGVQVSSSSSSAASDSDSSMDRRDRRPGPASRRRIRTLSQVVADMAKDRDDAGETNAAPTKVVPPRQDKPAVLAVTEEEEIRLSSDDEDNVGGEESDRSSSGGDGGEDSDATEPTTTDEEDEGEEEQPLEDEEHQLEDEAEMEDESIGVYSDENDSEDENQVLEEPIEIEIREQANDAMVVVADMEETEVVVAVTDMEGTDAVVPVFDVLEEPIEIKIREQADDAVVVVADMEETEVVVAVTDMEETDAVVPVCDATMVPQTETVVIPPSEMSAVNQKAVVPELEVDQHVLPAQPPSPVAAQQPPRPASPLGPRTRRQSQQASTAASSHHSAPTLTKLELLHVDPVSDVIQTRSRTRQQSGSTVSSLSPRQPASPVGTTGMQSPSPGKTTPVKSTPAKSRSKQTTPLPSPACLDKRDKEVEDEIQETPRTPEVSRTRPGPASSKLKPMPRSAARALRRRSGSSEPRPVTPFAAAADDTLDVIKEGDDPWQPRGMRLRLSSGTDSEKTVEMMYDVLEATNQAGPSVVPPPTGTSGSVTARQTRSSSRLSTRSESSEQSEIVVRAPSASPSRVGGAARGRSKSPRTPIRGQDETVEAVAIAPTAPVETEGMVESRSRSDEMESDVLMSVEPAEIVTETVSPTPEDTDKQTLDQSKPKEPKAKRGRPRVSIARLSTDTTPGTPQFTVIKSRASVSSAIKQFSFAEPTIVADKEEEDEAGLSHKSGGLDELPKTPQTTFIFSPPLTRSRVRDRTRKPGQEDEEGETSAAKQQQMKPPKTPRMDKSNSSKSESPIGFLTQMDVDSESQSQGSSRRSTSIQGGNRRKSVRQSLVARAHKTLIQTRRSARFQ